MYRSSLIQIYYGSYYYVKEEFRSRGFGTRLRDQVARGHVGENILCIDAVAGSVAKKNAEKFDYVDAYITRRLEFTPEGTIEDGSWGGNDYQLVSVNMITSSE